MISFIDFCDSQYVISLASVLNWMAVTVLFFSVLCSTMQFKQSLILCFSHLEIQIKAKKTLLWYIVSLPRVIHWNPGCVLCTHSTMLCISAYNRLPNSFPLLVHVYYYILYMFWRLWTMHYLRNVIFLVILNQGTLSDSTFLLKQNFWN